MCYEQQKGLDGVGGLMKNLWLIIDNPKIEAKEKTKAYSEYHALISQYK
jgi:hypothetical protein